MVTLNEKVSSKSSVWVHLYNYLGKGKEMEFYRKKSEPLLWKYKEYHLGHEITEWYA